MVFYAAGRADSIDMFFAIEIFVLLLLTVLSASSIVYVYGGAELFLTGLPAVVFLVACANVYYAVIVHYRRGGTGLLRRLLIHVAVTAGAILAVVYSLNPGIPGFLSSVFLKGGDGGRIVLKGRYGSLLSSWASQALAMNFKPADGLFRALCASVCLILGAVVVCALRNSVESLVRHWTRKIFLRHQHRIDALLSEDEEVKRAFLVFEGRWYPLKFLFSRPVIVLWTSARIVLLRELAGSAPPAEIRSIPVLGIRTVRGGERFLRPLGLYLEIELVNRDKLRFWVLSRSIAEEVGEALSASVQQLHLMQGGFDGPVVRYICPYCLGEAGRGRAGENCPVCGRSLRGRRLARLVRWTWRLAVLFLAMAVLSWALGPSMHAVCRGPGGERLVLEGNRLRVFNGAGKVIKVGIVPAAMRNGGGGRFMLPYQDGGTLVGGPSGLYLWRSGKFEKMFESGDSGELRGAAVLPDGRIVGLCEKHDDWVLVLCGPSAGRRGRVLAPLPFLPTNPPARLIGALRNRLVISMSRGGLALYDFKGVRKSWLVRPEDCGLIAGGAVTPGNSVRFVDLEAIRPWSLVSRRDDVVETVDVRDGRIRRTSLGKRRLPLLGACFLPGLFPVRPSLVCRGSGGDLWLLDELSGRLVRVTAGGKVLDDFSRGRLASWLNEIRLWRAVYWASLLAAMLLALLSIAGRLIAGR